MDTHQWPRGGQEVHKKVTGDTGQTAEYHHHHQRDGGQINCMRELMQLPSTLLSIRNAQRWPILRKEYYFR
ncbi:hypothetical protein DMENIID0001_041800 [Sergentomyia squamirostris]